MSGVKVKFGFDKFVGSHLLRMDLLVDPEFAFLSFLDAMELLQLLCPLEVFLLDPLHCALQVLPLFLLDLPEFLSQLLGFPAGNFVFI